MTALTIAPPAGLTASQAVGLWLATYPSLNTQRAYRRELEAFSAYLNLPVEAGMAEFLKATSAQAHAVVDAWVALRQNKEPADSPAAINRSLSALSSFIRAARRYGATTLHLEPRTIASRKYRDTRGPGTAGVQKLLDAARAQAPWDPWKAARDEALIRVLFSMGLRRFEITECDLKHLDVGAAMLSIKGKGELERRVLTVPPTALAAVVTWLEHRGDAPGSLFLNKDGGALGAHGLYHIVGDLGRKAGIKARPHGLRHAAITAVLDATNGDMRKAQAFGRHASASTTVAYDDNRADLGGAAARLLDTLME